MQGAASQIPLLCAGGATTEAYKQYAESPSTSLYSARAYGRRQDREPVEREKRPLARLWREGNPPKINAALRLGSGP
jgi:hypothetical protein